MADLEYDAILVDTSIFDGNGLRLESGLLGKLKQFAKSPVEFLMPDVIRNEIQSHLDKKIKVARNALEKSINDAGDNLFFDGSALNAAKKLIVDSKEVEGLAQSRLDQFLADTGALLIECDDHISVKELLVKYFHNEAPFSKIGKKKSEFPDAIVLMAIESWAEKEGKKVLAVAKDKDWEAYCKSSEHIDYIEDFSEGLSKFNAATAPYALLDNLKSALERGQAAQFLSRIESGLQSALDGFTPDQEAESQFYWEPEGSNGWFKKFELYDYDFRVIDTDEDWVVIEVWANITVEAEGEFSLSVHDSIDRDYVSLGGVSVTAEAEFESEILITVSGDLNGDINELDIDEVEIIDPINSVDFGTLELDYGDYE
ncbi:PIN domain-containing protein [Pectobacterium polaris]|uniref:PIN domain-containing protein n=1 Tax=Pectobacterium polaris TaxID=2042057 RepID=UPI001F1E1B05|nr:PIN domain-containing protein [Pectobacterium polaris]